MNQENKEYNEELQKNEDRVLIEESDAGRRRREAAAAEPKKSKARPWLIAVAAVVLVGIIAGLAVYFVQNRNSKDVYERTISTVTTEKATTTEEDFEIEDSDDIVIAGDDAIGGEMGGMVEEEATIRTETTGSLEDEDADDEDADEDDSTTKKTTKKTTKRTTRRTTVWDARQASKAIDDFWNGVSKAVS